MERLDYEPILNYGFSITASCMNFQTEFRFLLKNFIVSVPFLVLVPNIEVPKEVSRLRQHARGCQSFKKNGKLESRQLNDVVTDTSQLFIHCVNKYLGM